MKLELKTVITLVAGFVTATVIVFSTFASKEYVEEKHQSVLIMFKSIERRLDRIESLQREILRRSK